MTPLISYLYGVSKSVVGTDLRPLMALLDFLEPHVGRRDGDVSLDGYLAMSSKFGVLGQPYIANSRLIDDLSLANILKGEDEFQVEDLGVDFDLTEDDFQVEVELDVDVPEARYVLAFGLYPGTTSDELSTDGTARTAET